MFSLAPIVFAMLFSLARADHTAFASHSGDSSLNGFIEPVINPRADISAVQFKDIVLVPVQNALAHRVPVAVRVISLVPEAYIEPTSSPVAVTIISQVPVADTTSERSHRATRVISQVPSPFTPITGEAVLES